MVGMAATTRCGSTVEGVVRMSGSGTHSRVRDDTAVVWVVFHGDIKVDADEDAFSGDGVSKGWIIDEELVCEGHGRGWGASGNWIDRDLIWLEMGVGM